jgi:hypothetical protein
MRAKIILATLIIWGANSICTSADEPVFVDPDTTQFRFTAEVQGTNKFCNLIVSAVKVPGWISFNAVAMRRGPGDHSMGFGYEIEAFESSKIQHGVPSVPQRLQVQEAGISSDLFSSKGSVDRAQAAGALYTVKEAALSNFMATVTRGHYFINIQLSDGRNLTFIIRDDETLLSAADKWLKCAIQIAK